LFALNSQRYFKHNVKISHFLHTQQAAKSCSSHAKWSRSQTAVWAHRTRRWRRFWHCFGGLSALKKGYQTMGNSVSFLWSCPFHGKCNTHAITAPYKEVCKDMSKKAQQTIITSFDVILTVHRR